MRHSGLTPDFAVSLPEQLPISDLDLTALLGNALDNAMEAGVKGGQFELVTCIPVPKA